MYYKYAHVKSPRLSAVLIAPKHTHLNLEDYHPRNTVFNDSILLVFIFKGFDESLRVVNIFVAVEVITFFIPRRSEETAATTTATKSTTVLIVIIAAVFAVGGIGRVWHRTLLEHALHKIPLLFHLLKCSLGNCVAVEAFTRAELALDKVHNSLSLSTLRLVTFDKAFAAGRTTAELTVNAWFDTSLGNAESADDSKDGGDESSLHG